MKKKLKSFPCEFCDGTAEPRVKQISFPFKGQITFVDGVPVWVCSKCGEEYFDAPVYKRLEEIAKRRHSLRRTIAFPLARYGALQRT